VNRTRLRLVASILNPMNDELYFQPATLDALAAFARQPGIDPVVNVFESNESLEPRAR
jgi:hypothetical protein